MGFPPGIHIKHLRILRIVLYILTLPGLYDRLQLNLNKMLKYSITNFAPSYHGCMVSYGVLYFK